MSHGFTKKNHVEIWISDDFGYFLKLYISRIFPVKFFGIFELKIVTGKVRENYAFIELDSKSKFLHYFFCKTV